MTPAVPSGRGPHVFVDDLEAPDLGADDRHHLERVRRVRTGEAVTVGDGVGGWRPCRFGPVLEPAGPIERVPRPEPVLTIGFALIKGERPEWIVQKLTEVGIDRIVPFLAERSVVRWDAQRRDRHHTRLTAIAREAAMQSGRLWLPEVLPPTDFATVVTGNVVLADRDGRPPSVGDTTVLVGPEGGWSAMERASAPLVRLAGPVLRAETAAVAAAVVQVGLRDGVLRPA